MKKNLFFYLIVLSAISQSLFSQTSEQDLPSEFGIYTIPLWSKAVLELKSVDSTQFEYRILSLERYDEYYSFNDPQDLFDKQPQENTIEIYFVGAYFNEGKEDSDYKTTLVLRNNLKTPVNYSADIKYYFKEEFENTSIVGAFPNAKTIEMWHRKIDLIALYDFRILDTK
ncbi:hypothetical protein GWK09_14875 [Muriicola jejuensis]|uniref:DUF3124 domain-containing protein n=2 Tax=Muriicola jejuensis TaxID=504488 RepID=A0A6P0UIS6_9FLAO|nr:hypothetical protein [Muriicola jejuensis]